MIDFARLVHLLIALSAIGCGQSSPADVAPALPLATDTNRTDGQSAPASDIPFAVQKVGGGTADPFAASDAKAVVLIFVSTDCPIANRYAPELDRLYETFRTNGVAFWLVYSDPSESLEKIRKHIDDYHHRIPAIRDADHQLAKYCEVKKTPEAALFNPGRQRLYRGRIDNRFADYGKSLQAASRHDLQAAIEDVLSARPVRTPVTEAVGCDIPGAKE